MYNNISNVDLFYNTIPGFIIPQNLILFDIHINDYKLKAMIDTGSTKSIIFNKTIKKCNLNNIVDRSNLNMLTSANGNIKSTGKIWYLDVLIDKYSIPASFDILEKGIDNFDIILGLDFLTFYNVSIDFKYRKLILDDRCTLLF